MQLDSAGNGALESLPDWKGRLRPLVGIADDKTDPLGSDGRVDSHEGALNPGDIGLLEASDNLVRDLLKGDPGAIRIVSGWARSVAAHRVWGFQSPEDIVQATLLAMIQNLRENRFHGGNLQAYVRRIAKNMCITHYRRTRAKGEHVVYEENDTWPAARVSGEGLEIRALIARLLQRLKDDCRDIIQLAYLQGYSRREIGKRFGISQEAARIKLFRCIRSARNLLAEFGESECEGT